MNDWLGKPQVRLWLAIVGVSTLILGTAYTMVQQSIRLSANDEPIIASQNAARDLKNGSSPSEVVPDVKTDLRYDWSVFTIITDGSQHVLASSATLDGRTPLPPKGTFEYARDHASDHFTWQPEKDVRMATNIMYYGGSSDGNFIVTGHSLRPFEDRVSTVTALAAAGWLASLSWATLLLIIPTQKILIRRGR